MRARLIAAARALFASQGFAATGTPEIVERAKVTRGALYHHFADKTALLHAVVSAEAEALAAEIERLSKPSRDPQEALRAGTRAFFAAMKHPGRARLLLIEGPAVLGLAEMERIDAAGGRATLLAGLSAARPEVKKAELVALAQLLSAGFDRAALAISEGAPEAPYLAAMMRLIGAVAEG